MRVPALPGAGSAAVAEVRCHRLPFSPMCIGVFSHTRARISALLPLRVRRRACVRTYVRACVHACMHACVLCVCMRASVFVSVCACVHPCMRGRDYGSVARSGWLERCCKCALWGSIYSVSRFPCLPALCGRLRRMPFSPDVALRPCSRLTRMQAGAFRFRNAPLRVLHVSGMSFVCCVVTVSVLYDEQNQTHDDGGDLRRPRTAVKPRHNGTSQAKAARRRQRRRGVFGVDGAWSQGGALGRVQRVAGCGCVVPEQTLATDQPSVPPSRGRASYQWGDPEWEVLWRGLESLLFHVANLLQDPCAAFAATVARMSSKMQDSADPHLGLDLARSHVQRRMGSHSSGKPDAGGTAKSTSCARERQAVLDVVWGMAVMRPRIKLAQVVLRSVPRWRSFQRHRHMAKRLMPHWFPL